MWPFLSGYFLASYILLVWDKCVQHYRGQSPNGGLVRIVLHGEEYLAVSLSKFSCRIFSWGCDVAPNGCRKSPDWTEGRKAMNCKEEKKDQIHNDWISDACLNVMTLTSAEILVTSTADRDLGLWEHRPQNDMDCVLKTSLFSNKVSAACFCKRANLL